MPTPPAKKNSSASLGSKLIFLRHQLGRERSPESQENAPNHSSSPPDVRRRMASPQSDSEDFSSDWTEPPATRQRRQPKPPAMSPDANTKLHLPSVIEHPRPARPATSLTNPRHSPLTGSVGKKPQAPPHDPRIVGLLAAGGSQKLKPLKREARVQRRRAIFIGILCVIALLIAWALFAK